MVVIEVKCRYCGQETVVKNGRAPNGLQRFHGPACRRYFQVEYHYNGRKPGTAHRIVDMAFNGSGVRDTGRVLGSSKNTVIRRLKKISPRPGEQSTASYTGFFTVLILSVKRCLLMFLGQEPLKPYDAYYNCLRDFQWGCSLPMERHNLALRTYIKRLARQIICFSKSVELHEKVIGAYIDKFHYQSL